MPTNAHIAWLRVSPSPGANLGVSSLEFITEMGIRGDRHAKPNSRNQVLLMDVETLDSLNLSPGSVRENVATRGIDIAALEEGVQIQLGSKARLVISHPCDPCHKLEAVRPGLEAELEAPRRGMLATVTQGGIVIPGDPITVTKTASLT